VAGAPRLEVMKNGSEVERRVAQLEKELIDLANQQVVLAKLVRDQQKQLTRLAQGTADLAELVRKMGAV
jgi:hypothetical protein